MVASAPMRSAKVLAGLMLLVPTMAWAQEDDSDSVRSALAEDDSASAAQPSGSTSRYSTTEQPFRPRRGLSAEGEFGVFFTLGGRDANDPQEGFPSRTVSNAGPYVAVIVGYDVYETDGFALSIGPKFGAAYNSGSARLTESDIASVGDDAASTYSNDYGAYEASLNLSAIFMVTDRLAVTGKVNGGVAFIDVNPTVDSADPDAGNLAIGGLFGVSGGVEWYTLLNGFSVGLQVRFQGLLVDGFIPGIAIPATLRYTF